MSAAPSHLKQGANGALRDAVASSDLSNPAQAGLEPQVSAPSGLSSADSVSGTSSALHKVNNVGAIL